MKRYLLDTNIIVFLFRNKHDIDKKIAFILKISWRRHFGLRTEIDVLVYALYDLSREERAIVEGS